MGAWFGNLANRPPAAAADVHSQSVELVCLGGKQIGARDIFNEGKVTCLLAIFIKDRRQVVQQTRAENRNHAGVRIEDRLARSVSAGITQRDRGNTDLLPPKKYQSLLVNFGQPVNCFPAHRRVLRRRRALAYLIALWAAYTLI